MNRKLGFLLLLALCLNVLFFSSAMTDTVDSGSCGDNVTWTLDEKGVLTISGSGGMSNYYPLMGRPAPWGTAPVQAVIEDGVTSIGYSAFRDCISLTSVTIPDSMTAIGEFAFEGCTGLSNVTIPDSVTSIGRSAFNGCSGLTDVTIPENVMQINSDAFSNCENLSSFQVLSGNKRFCSVNGVLFSNQCH